MKINIPISESTISQLKLKDLKHLEHWALVNNLYVHPAYLAAVKKQRKLLIQATIVGTVLGILLIVLILKIAALIVG